jgi:hypothetical protein
MSAGSNPLFFVMSSTSKRRSRLRLKNALGRALAKGRILSKAAGLAVGKW